MQTLESAIPLRWSRFGHSRGARRRVVATLRRSIVAGQGWIDLIAASNVPLGGHHGHGVVPGGLVTEGPRALLGPRVDSARHHQLRV